MSWCFPFPPPGYEKKTRLDDVSLVIKEKQKQKNHKRDKEKKERSERKEKEKSGKDKGEPEKEKKHREKKHKKKDKHKSSEETENGGSFENPNGETLVPDIKTNNEVQDSRILVELGKRLRNDEGAVDIRMAQKITAVDKKNISLLERVEHHIDNHVVGEYDDYREKRELSRMDNSQYLKVDSRGLGNGFDKNFSGQTERGVQNKVEDLSSKADSFDQKKVEKEKDKQTIGGKGDRKNLEERDKGRKSEDKKRKEKTESVNEPIKQRGSNNFPEPNISTEESCEFPNLPKRKEPQLNGFLHDNEIWPNSMPGPVSLSHQSSQNGSGSHPTQTIRNLTVRKPAPTSNHKVIDENLPSKPVNRNTANGEPGQRPDYL